MPPPRELGLLKTIAEEGCLLAAMSRSDTNGAPRSDSNFRFTTIIAHGCRLARWLSRRSTIGHGYFA
jgi:hypothetical protein